MDKEGLQYSLLYPGDCWEVSEPNDNISSKEKYRRSENTEAPITDSVPKKTFAEISEAFSQRSNQIAEDHFKVFTRMLKPITVNVPDIGVKIRLSISDGTIVKIGEAEKCDLEINSQPLWFCFKFPFGLQTLGVSARYTLYKNENIWRRYRIFFSLNNSEIYLSNKLFSIENVKWLASRFFGSFNQLFYQLKRM